MPALAEDVVVTTSTLLPPPDFKINERLDQEGNVVSLLKHSAPRSEGACRFDFVRFSGRCGPVDCWLHRHPRIPDLRKTSRLFCRKNARSATLWPIRWPTWI